MKHLVFDDVTLNTPTLGEPKVAPKKAIDFKPTATLQPGIEWDGDVVEVTSDVYLEPVTDFDQLLIDRGYDVEKVQIVGPVKVKEWNQAAGEDVRTLYSYGYSVDHRITSKTYRDEDYKDLVNLIKKHRPNKNVGQAEEGYFVVNLADWQLGKADGDGTHGTVKRLMQMIDDVDARIDELIKSGRKMDTLVVALVGDMNENCEGHYASQTFTVELNRRQQLRLLRRILTKAISTWSKKFKRAICLAVPGNHGENRLNGKAFTTRGDNDDVSCLEMVFDIFQANPEAYGHVEFVIPEDDLYVTLQLGSKIVGWAHGHVAGSGGDSQKKIKEWWKDQAFCSEPMGDADILVTGHYHHFTFAEYDDDKIHFQCPAMDGGSQWFRDIKGVHSRSGTLTFVIDDTGRPFRDLEII